MNRRDWILTYYGKLFLSAICVLCLLSLGRLGFLMYFADSKYGLFDYLPAFFLGIRFDLIVTCYVIFPMFLISILASMIKIGANNFFPFLIKNYLRLMMVLLSIVLIFDIGFYSYFQDHINILIFGIWEDDTKALAESIWKNYPIGWALTALVIFWITCFWIVGKIFKNFERPYFKFPLWFHFILPVLLMLLLIVGARGSWGPIPLSQKNAEAFVEPFLNDLSQNGVISLYRTVNLRKKKNDKKTDLIKQFGYSNNIKKAFEDYLGIPVAEFGSEDYFPLIERSTTLNPIIEKQKPHVVLVIMESFGTYWLKFQDSKMNLLGDLQKHFDEDILFKNFISSEIGTIGSLQVILSNLPHRPGFNFLTESEYLNTPLDTFAHLPYKKAGYETNFIYAGNLGWRNIGRYMKAQNFDRVVGDNFIKNELKLDHQSLSTEWGLFDEYVYEYTKKLIQNSHKPQFIVILTTTNHPPFELPAHYKVDLELSDSLRNRVLRDQDLIHKRMKAFRYANEKFAQFVAFIKESDLKDKSVVAMTGDHNFWGSINYTREETFQKYLTPFYIYSPLELRPMIVNPNVLGSHLDIMPTLYHLTLSNMTYYSLGKNLMTTNLPLAWNSRILANETGIKEEEDYYLWNDINSRTTQLEKHTEKLNDLDIAYKAYLSITDYYFKFKVKKP